MKYSSYSEFCSKNPGIADCLIKAEKRPAKVGEWVLLTNVLCPTHYHNGEIYKVSEIILGKPVISGKTWGTVLLQSEYEVLDGYTPEPEKEPEPVYLNMKVVCVDNSNYCWWTTGKCYTFKNGVIVNDIGEDYSPVKSLEECSRRHTNAKFIPYLGE